jgi:hypothetical protein
MADEAQMTSNRSMTTGPDCFFRDLDLKPGENSFEHLQQTALNGDLQWVRRPEARLWGALY